jgi:tetratricopeptide (TPR) repeat protein
MSRSPLGPGSELDVLLLETFHAYRRGLLRQPLPHSSMPPRDFDALMFLGTIGWIPLADRLQLRGLGHDCGQGLTAARQGRFDESIRHYKQAREHLDRLQDGTRPAWLLGVSTYRSGVAYLDFRRGFAQQAREHLDRAMDADLELEQMGLPVMQMNRIQQGHNLARMEFRLRGRRSAIALAAALLAYLEGQIKDLPYHRDWGPKGLRAVPRGVLEAMIHQILGETAGCIVTGEAPPEEWSVLIETSRLRGDPETAVSPQAQYALRAQRNLLMNDPEGYLRDLERFFRFGIGYCHRLWYAVMVEWVDFCREADTHRSRQVRDVILRDSAKWKGLPSFLRDRLGHPAARRGVA